MQTGKNRRCFKRIAAWPSMVMLSGAVALAAFAALPGTAVAQMKPPACKTLVEWGGSVDPHATYAVAPRVSLPKAFQEPQFSTMFGLPALNWSQADFQTTKKAIDVCYRDARKRRDRNAGKALKAAYNELLRVLPKATAYLQRSKDAAEAAKKAIDGLPDSAELARGIGILLDADPAAPDTNPLRRLPQEIGRPIYQLARTLPTLADSERESTFKALAERRDAIGAGMIAAAEKSIAAAPADAAGVIALIDERRQVAEISDTTARTRLEQQTNQRVKHIRADLRQASPAVWVPPRCIDIYRWAGEPGANQGVAVGRSSIYQMLSDSRAVPMFGISVGDWTDTDLSLLRKLLDYCRTEVTALKRQARHGSLTAEQTALVQAADKAGWIDDKSRDTLFTSTRTTLRAYRQAVADLQAAEAKIAALPDTTESLAALSEMRAQPALNKVGEQDWNHFRDVFNAKLQAIGAREAETAIKGLDGIEVTQLSDLAKLRDYAAKVEPTIPVRSGLQSFGAAFNHRMREAATQLLPQFQSRLAAMPATPEGIRQVRSAVADLTGIDDRDKSPALAPLRDAVEKRTDAIIKTMRTQACAGLLASLGASDDARQPFWDGAKGTTLGDWICRLAEQGVAVSAYSGTGLSPGTSTVKVTMPHSTLQTISLHKGEVLPGKEMLVGFEIKGVNQVTKLTAAQWADMVAATRAGVIADIGDCKRFAQIEPDQVTAADKPFWLQCGLQLSNMGNRGR